MKAVGFLELVYGILFEPKQTFCKIAQNPPLVTAFFVYTIVNVLNAAAGLLILQTAGTGEFEKQLIQLIGAAIPGTLVVVMLFFYIKWFVYSGLLHLISELLGGEGRSRKVLAVYGVAGLPGIFAIPAEFFLITAGITPPAIENIMGLLGILLFLWSVFLLVLGIKEVENLSTARAFLVVIIPALALLFLFFAVIVMLFSFAFYQPGSRIVPF